MKAVIYRATGAGTEHETYRNVGAVRGSHNTDKVILETHNKKGEKVGETELNNVDTYHITEE